MNLFRGSLVGVIAAGGLFLLASDGIACNDCDWGCDGLNSHYDTCGYAIIGWNGGCLDGCKSWSTCSVHTESCEVVGMTGDEVRRLLDDRDWTAIATASLTEALEFSADRGMLMVPGCDGSLVEQIPVEPGDVAHVLDAIATQQEILLADV